MNEKDLQTVEGEMPNGTREFSSSGLCRFLTENPSKGKIRNQKKKQARDKVLSTDFIFVF
jgi:hypothetical protein